MVSPSTWTFALSAAGLGSNGGRKTDVGFVGAPNFDCGRPGGRGVGGMYVDVVVRDSTHDENPRKSPPTKLAPGE